MLIISNRTSIILKFKKVKAKKREKSHLREIPSFFICNSSLRKRKLRNYNYSSFSIPILIPFVSLRMRFMRRAMIKKSITKEIIAMIGNTISPPTVLVALYVKNGIVAVILEEGKRITIRSPKIPKIIPK